jgi:hypothetical protein
MMNSIMMSRRVRAAVASVATMAVAVFAVACADKGLLPPRALPYGKVALQVTTVANQQQVGTTANWLLITVLTEPDDPSGSGNTEPTILGHVWAPFALGTTTFSVTSDLSRCPSGPSACPFMIAVALLPDTVPLFDSDGNQLGNLDPISTAFDYTIAGPFEFSPGSAPTIPPISVGATKFAVNQWVGDEALRVGGGEGLSSLTSWLTNVGNTPVAGVPTAGGNPTLYTSGIECVNNTTNLGCTPLPHLTILQPNGLWRRVVATQAAPGNSTFHAFNDISAVSTSEVYMSSGSGLYRFDGSAISRVSAVNDSAFSVSSVVTATNQKLVIVGSQAGVVSIGNGTTFTRYTLPGTTARVDNVCITGPNEAFAAQFIGGGIFRFDGTTWTSVPAQFSGGKFDLQCPSAGQAFVLAFNQGLLRWTGSSWTTMPISGLGPGRAGIRWGVASSNEIYAWSDTSSGADRAYYRFNGTSWTEVGRSRYGNGGGRMWATAGHGYHAQHNSRIEHATPTSLSVASYQPSLLDVVVTSATSAFAVGENMFLGRFNGTKWNVDPPPPGMRTTRGLTSVWSDGASKAWAVGNANTIVRWEVGAGGSTWLKVSDTLSAAGAPDNYWGVWGSGSDAWIVGDNTLLRCTIGSTCTTQSSGGGALLGIWGAASNNIFAVGENGRILRYNGTTWTPMSSGTNRRLARVTGTGSSDVWAVGDSVLLRYDGNSAGTWSVVQDSNLPFDEFADAVKTHIPTAAERLPGPQQGSAYRFLVGVGIWARSPGEVYLASDDGGGSLFRFYQSRWNNISTNSNEFRRRYMGISGTGSGCVLAVTHMQGGGSSRPNLFRGVGPNTCFNGPMGAVTSWP